MTRTRAPDPPPLTPAPAELAAYAAKVGKLDEADVRGGIQAQQTAGMPWSQIQLNVILMLNHRGTPSDLRNAAGTYHRSRTVTTT